MSATPALSSNGLTLTSGLTPLNQPGQIMSIYSQQGANNKSPTAALTAPNSAFQFQAQHCSSNNGSFFEADNQQASSTRQQSQSSNEQSALVRQTIPLHPSQSRSDSRCLPAPLSMSPYARNALQRQMATINLNPNCM